MMHRIHTAQNTEESEIDITPMLDVVFIMLIFFIVTASFVKESGLGLLNPPISEPQEVPAQPIVVEVTELGDITIQNRVVSSKSIKPTIIRMKAEKPDAAVVVRAHGNAKTKLLVEAVDGVREANVDLPAISIIRG